MKYDGLMQCPYRAALEKIGSSEGKNNAAGGQGREVVRDVKTRRDFQSLEVTT